MALKKCCCCVDLLNGVRILGIVLLVLTCLSIICTIGSIASTGEGSYVGIVGALPSLIVNALLIWACNEKKKLLLLPWLIVKMIFLIISVICICVLFYFGGHLISVDDDNVHAAAIIYFTAASISLFSVALFFYFWFVVFALYNEMGRDGNNYQMQPNYGISYTNQTVPKSNMDHENY